MLRSDRLLAAIVVGLAVLVVVAFVAVLRQSPPQYQGAGTPAGAANDYLLALANRDYAKAYSLLSDALPAKPKTLEDLIRDVDEQPYTFGTQDESASIRILGTELTSGPAGEELASVRVERTVFADRGLLDSSQFSESSVLRLRKSTDGQWRISGGDRFVHPCWLQAEGCANKPVAPVKGEAYP